VPGNTLLNVIYYLGETGKADTAIRPSWQVAGMTTGTCTSQNNWQITMPFKTGQLASIGI